MSRVYGRVVVKETNVGLPDIVVALFDVDASRSVAKANAPTHVPAAQSISEGRFEDRLGSVLTDAAGRFEVAFDEKDFQIGDQERRPDLVLIAFGPEDIANPTSRESAPPSARVLLASRVPREDAGRTEAYVLRIPESVLNRFEIPLPTSPSPRPSVSATALANAARASHSLEQDLRNELRTERRALLSTARTRTAAAKRFAASLSGMPQSARRSPTFLLSERDESATIRAAIESSLARIEGMGMWDIRFRFTEDDFRRMGLVPPSEYDEVLTLDHETLCQLMGARRAGPALQRAVDLIEQRRRESRGLSELEALVEGAADSEDVGSTEEGGAPASGLPDLELVTAGIRGQITDLAVPPTGAASSLEELSARVAGFRLPPGPADVTSIHDFHQLQIAFRHVWTEAFDEDLRELVEHYYDTVAELHEDTGGTFELPAEAGEIDEIAGLLRDGARDVEALASEAPPSNVSGLWGEEANRWHLLSELQQAELASLATEILSPENAAYVFVIALAAMAGEDSAAAALERLEPEASNLLRLFERGKQILRNPRGRLGRLVRLRNEIAEKLTQPHAFHYFAPNSVNYGLLFTYRQMWKPLTYQVGDLVSTLPLAPGETRRYSAKVVRKTSRAEKEVERSMSSRRGESSETRRVEGEITAKASIATNFKHTAEGSFSIGIASIGSTTEFALNQAQESSRAKKDFREAVVKAAEEYRQERSVEVESSSETASEETSSGEISNPNNEVTVTYLFYELERQYRISERLHRVTPVILVAQDVPAPNEITESWLLQHAWILRRVVLDDALRPALDSLSDGFAGNELSVNLLRSTWEKQKGLVSKLEADVETHRNRRDELRALLVATERRIGMTEAGGPSDAARAAAAIFTGGLSLFRPDRSAEEVERLEVARKAFEMELEHLNEMIRDAESRLSRAADAFAAATREYQAALETQTNRRLQIDQLRMHVKENVLYYMQAIWDHEPPDQRFFRLYHRQVDLPTSSSARCTLRLARPEEVGGDLPTVERYGRVYVIEGCGRPELPPPDAPKPALIEIADVDRPLGYKGNYIIFPLKTCTYLTDFMMRDYLDGYFGLRDPDPAAGFTSEELLTYVGSILSDPGMSVDTELRDALISLVENRIRNPIRESDVVVVPSGQLYIEALVGHHPLLERFKLTHRVVDMAKARAELRQQELENLRRAARMLQSEPDYDDPEVDRRIRVEGNAGIHVDSE